MGVLANKLQKKSFLFESGYHVEHLPTLANVQSEWKSFVWIILQTISKYTYNALGKSRRLEFSKLQSWSQKASIYFFLVVRLRLIFISFSILNVRNTKLYRLVFKGSSQNINMHQHCCMLHVYLNARGIDSKIKTVMVACLCVTISLGTLYTLPFMPFL